jgi:hypothetical protein
VTSINDDAAGLGLEVGDGLLQLAVGQVLDLRVERQANVLAVLRRLDRADILDDLAAPILDHAAATRLPEKLAVKRQLDAFQPLVVDAGEADHVRGHLTGRIEAAVLLVLADAGQLERGDLVRRCRRYLATQEDEGLVAGQLAAQLLGVISSRAASCFDLLRSQRGIGGIAQTDFIGVDTARTSPLRSAMRPREALISRSRR